MTRITNNKGWSHPVQLSAWKFRVGKSAKGWRAQVLTNGRWNTCLDIFHGVYKPLYRSTRKEVWEYLEHAHGAKRKRTN